MGEDQLYFCYFSVTNYTELIVQSILTALSILLIANAFRKFWRMRQYHNSNVTFVYGMIAAWWITFLIANIMSIVIYLVHDKNPQGYSDQDMSTITKYYFVFDWLAAFCIQWLLLYIPYHWAKKITDIFCTWERGSDIEFTEREQYKGYQRYIYPGLKHYIRVRLAFLILPIIFLILSHEQILFKMMISSLLLDCICITASLIFGMISLRTTEQLKMQLDQQESKRTFNQYLMIIVANTLRFAYDMFVVVFNVFGDESYSISCPEIGNANNDLVISVSITILVCILTHYLPIFLILRIYNLEEKPEQICESLIASRDNPSGVVLSD